MACFIVPAAEAVAVTVADKMMEKKEAQGELAESKEQTAVPFREKLGWLTKLLWGGAILLAFEHVWHGEVVPYFPFLTAMSNPADASEMFHEMATVGVMMAALITVVWIGMCVVADSIVKRPAKKD